MKFQNLHVLPHIESIPNVASITFKLREQNCEHEHGLMYEVTFYKKVMVLAFKISKACLNHRGKITLKK